MDLDLTIRYLDDLTAHNVTVPEKAVRAADTYRAALTAAAEAPAADLHAALMDGTLTPDSVGPMVREAAIRQAAAQNAHQVITALRTTFNKVIRDALREHQSQIVADLRKEFEPAAKAVTTAAKHFGPDTTAEDVITARPDVVKQFNALAAHSQTLDTVSRLYRSLLSDITRELPADIVTLFVAKADDLNQADDLYRNRDRWISLARAGFTLRLNTPAEAASVTAGAAAKAAAALEAEKQKAVAASRHRHRFELGMGAR